MEWSVLTLSSQVPYAYIAMCGIQREAKKKSFFHTMYALEIYIINKLILV